LVYHFVMSDQNTNPQALPEHDEKTGSFAPRTAGNAYAEQENAKKNKKSPWPKIIALGVLLTAGGFYGWNRYLDYVQTSSTLVTADLLQQVRSLTAAEEEHGHAAALEPDVELRDRARSAIERFKKGQTALIARQSVTGLEPSQATILRFSLDNPDKPMKAAGLGLYRGILTQCFLSDHDVHWINDEGVIQDHISLETRLNESDEKARGIINKAVSREESVVVVVYETGFEVFNALNLRLDPAEM
jgi:hypothetical protein